ncbi:MAG: hypothetical protein M3680_24810 [Myxococcota bacterium]|nr:hypothetical protein [Myxococcota bacterium]
MLRRCVPSALVAGIMSVTALAGGCRTSLEDDGEPAGACKLTTTAPCMEADNHSDLAWIEANVFASSCAFSGCHNGAATAAGRINLKAGMSHAALVDVDSVIEPGRKLVVAGQPRQSYLMMMVQHVAPAEMDPPASEPPGEVGYMPQNAGGAVLCCQKLDALDRWITAGALND